LHFAKKQKKPYQDFLNFHDPEGFCWNFLNFPFEK